MAQFKNMYKVELNNGIAPVVSLKQIYYADVEANRIGAIVTMNGQPFPLSGTCTGSAILADGSTVPMAGVIDGNQAYIDLDSSCYSVEGPIKIFVKITTGDVTTTLLAAVGTVQLTETDTVIDPGTIIPSVSALITAIEDAVESIPADYTALLETIAPMYANLTFPVKAGQWCWYSGVLYEANQDISTSENWTAAHWKTTTVGGSVSELKSAIDKITIKEKSGVSGWESGYITSNGTIGSESTQCVSNYVTLNRDDELYLSYDNTVYGLGLIGHYDSNLVFIERIAYNGKLHVVKGHSYRFQLYTLDHSTLNPDSITSSDFYYKYISTDDTLSHQYKIADAKATGYSINNTREIISNNYYIPQWVQGGLTNGLLTDRKSRVRTNIMKLPKGSTISLLGGINGTLSGFYVAKYNAQGDFISISANALYLYKTENTEYIMLIAKYDNNSNITPADVANYVRIITPTYTNTLQNEYKMRLLFRTGNIDVTTGEDLDNIDEPPYNIGDFRVCTEYVMIRTGDTICLNENVPATIRQGFYVVLYDTNKTFTGNSNGYVTRYVAQKDCFVRLVMRYENEYTYIDNVGIFDNFVYVLKSVQPKKKYTGDFTTYYKPSYNGATGNAVVSLTTSDIYNRFDSLMALHSDEMSKNLIGYATNPNGTQNTNSPIYEYFISAQTSDRGVTMFDPDTILLSAGIHGDEKSPVVALAEFCEQIFNVDDDAYNTLRNFNIRIVPVINPYGFDNVSRLNARGVNLNRNFAYKWDTLSDSEKGSAPYSEYETQAVKDWLEANKTACLYIDYHNTAYELPNVSYHNSPNKELYPIYTSFIRTVTASWIKRFFPTRTGQTLGFLENNEWPTTYNEAYYSEGIKNSLILEVAWGDDDTNPHGYTYSNNIMKMALEQMLNYIRAVINHFYC